MKFGLIHESLRPSLVGLFLTVLTLFYGFAMGIAFGGFEHSFEAILHESALSVRDTIYMGDEAAMEPVLKKAWNYMQRAHLHAGGLGASSLGLILVAAFVGMPPLLLRITSIGLGGGSFGYSLYWMWAGFRAPGLGGTGPAKESLMWLAVPSSGAVVVSTMIVFIVLGYVLVRRNGPDGDASAGAGQ